jgi:hypothetical protein
MKHRWIVATLTVIIVAAGCTRDVAEPPLREVSASRNCVSQANKAPVSTVAGGRAMADVGECCEEPSGSCGSGLGEDDGGADSATFGFTDDCGDDCHPTGPVDSVVIDFGAGAVETATCAGPSCKTSPLGPISGPKVDEAIGKNKVQSGECKEAQERLAAKRRDGKIRNYAVFDTSAGDSHLVSGEIHVHSSNYLPELNDLADTLYHEIWHLMHPFQSGQEAENAASNFAKSCLKPAATV